MTPQEIFDKIWDHLNRQGMPSIHAKGGCAYRGANGAACAVGCLVDDKTAKQWDEMPDASFEGILENREDVPDHLRANELLVTRLQLAHDNDRDFVDWLPKWQGKMHRIAKQHNLTVPPIPEPTL